MDNSHIHSLKTRGNRNRLIPNKILVLGSFFVCVGSVCAQSLQRSSISALGSSVATDGYTISQTVGQPYGTSTKTDNEMVYKPGFQQASFVVSTIRSSIHTTLFPNPATYMVTIQTNVPIANVTMKVVDIKGIVIQEKYFTNFVSENIDCSHWVSSMYFLNLYANEQELSSNKIIISK